MHGIATGALIEAESLHLARGALHAACGLPGLPRGVVGPGGLDQHGIFFGSSNQEAAPPHVLSMLRDPARAEGVLIRGAVTGVRSLEADHILFEATLRVAPEDRDWVGEPEISVAFKPATSGTYGREWRRELAFYKLGQYVEALGLIPIVEREVAVGPIQGQLLSELTEDQAGRLPVDLVGGADEVLYGSVQLWVTGYSPVVGTRKLTNSTISHFAKKLSTKTEPSVLNDPLWQALSDMIVLDFVLANSDRSLEGGTAKLPGGRQLLVMLDNGDTFLPGNPDKGDEKARLHFEKLSLFSPNVLERLSELDEERAAEIFVDAKGKSLGTANQLRRVARRSREVVRKARVLGRKGRRVVIFPQRSRDRVLP